MRLRGEGGGGVGLRGRRRGCGFKRKEEGVWV